MSTARISLLFLFVSPCLAVAGGPRRVAGASYFDPGVMGQPVRWASGQINYYVDRGPLSATVSHDQAVSMVDAAAALWNAVPTAAVSLVNKGQLNEDVSGDNAVPGDRSLQAPEDVAPTATNYPLGIVFDTDGAVIDSVLGTDYSDPTNCQTTGVVVLTDNVGTDAVVRHALMIVNGRCTDTLARMQMMNFLLERGFGLVLGLGASQVYPRAARNGQTDLGMAWPVMQPQAGLCGFNGGACIPGQGALKYDDVAEVNRLYPVTGVNQAAVPGKQLTATATVSIQGTITFRAGSGMQGVNVVAVPLDASGNPLVQYTMTAVSGALYAGRHGTVVTGWADQDGVDLSQYGSTDAALQGFFDLSSMPLPPGMSSAAYRITFESIDPLFTQQMTVGPYYEASPSPSGTLSAMTVTGLKAGSAKTLAINVADSAIGEYHDAIATEESPRLLPASGLWSGRISQVGQTDWIIFPIRGNRTFTVVTIATDESGLPSGSKAMPAIGAWDAFAPVGTPSAGTSAGLNGNATGESWLRLSSQGDDVVRLGIADMRGDGRPDYAYNGWVLYADTVQPARLPASGGPIVIRGMGFRSGDTVKVNGKNAQVTSISPNEITAIAPPAKTGFSGSVDVEVDDLPIYYSAAILSGELSYDAGNGDSLKLVTAPANTVPMSVPIPFTVQALGPDLAPAGGVTVTYAVASGTAVLACGKTSCPVSSTGDGTATMNVTATSTSASVVIASLGNGSSLQAHFTGGTPPTITALTPSLSVAAGASLAWTTQALVLKNGQPAAGQVVAWKAGTGMSVGSSPSATSSSSGVASQAVTVGPLSGGQQVAATACVNGTSQCTSFTALGARPEYAWLEAVAGTNQSVAATATPAQITLRVRDTGGNPMAGATVTLYQSVYAWAPPCPPHGRCAQPELLGTQVSIATSGLDGTVSFAPAGLPGVASTTLAVASTGGSSTLNAMIEMHP